MKNVLIVAVVLTSALFSWAQSAPKVDAPILASASPTELTAERPPSTVALPDAPSASPAGAMAEPTPVPQQGGIASSADGWHGAISIYGWFPGVHGTVGVAGHDAGIHASFSDVFHYLKGVIPIAVEANKGRFLMPLDFFWVKLGDDKGIPFNELGQTSVNIHLTESIFTPKFGYRILDKEKFKIDALAGIRYWHVAQELTLEPSGVNRSQSANWVDGLGGARFILPLGEKAAIMVGGDGGGGGASLDYQAVGLLTYNFTPKLGLGLGWRYLDVNYHPRTLGFLYDVAQTGALAGMYFNFGGKPPVPPAATCSLSPTQLEAGQPVTANINTQNFNLKHKVEYKWSGNGLKVSGSGETASVETVGLAPGSYSVNATAIDPKEKKNNTASCNASFTVLQPPRPPVASCSANPATVRAGDPSTIAVDASSPDSVPLSYAYSANQGSISGSGPNATLNTSSAQPGSTITATATVTDSRGLSTSCNATVNILSPPVVVQEVKEIGECKFMNPKKPWRVDNECKAVLDDVALRLQRQPNGKLVVVGYAEEEEKVKYEQLGAQRAVNVKYYLTAGEGGQRIDPAMIEPRVGTKSDRSAKFYFVPAGASFTAEETIRVDESAVQGQPRNAPAPRKSKKKAPTPVQ